MIKEIRSIWKLPLIEARDLLDSRPATLQEDLPWEEADRLHAAGATVRLR